eukprot:gene1017-1157_t
MTWQSTVTIELNGYLIPLATLTIDETSQLTVDHETFAELKDRYRRNYAQVPDKVAKVESLSKLFEQLEILEVERASTKPAESTECQFNLDLNALEVWKKQLSYLYQLDFSDEKLTRPIVLPPPAEPLLDIHFIGGMSPPQIYAISANIVPRYYSRLDRFDTQTNTTVSLGDPAYPINSCRTFIHQGMLFGVGGNDSVGPVNRIVTIDLTVTNNVVAKEFINNLFPSVNNREHISASCFDGQEYIYMLSSKSQFIRLSIITRQINYLTASPHDTPIYDTPVHCANRQRIYFVHKKIATCYDIATNQWLDLAPPPVSLICHGAVGV